MPGALAVFHRSSGRQTPAELQRGSMTHELSIDPVTGDTEETNVIAFLDP
jgi:hypothetical protein